MTEARILAVADCFDAMCFHRPWRPGLGVERALEKLSESSGKLFDARMTEACIQIYRTAEIPDLYIN